MNAVSACPVPHTVRVPVALRELVSVMLERGEIAPGAVATTLQHAMRHGLAAAVEVDDQPRPPPRRRRRRIITEEIKRDRLARVDGLARAVKVARAQMAAGATRTGAAAALNELGLLNTRRLAPVPWNAFSLARAMSMQFEP